MTDQDLVLHGQHHHKKILNMNVFQAAKERMEYIYDHFDIVVVMWSGGKDSTSVLEMARMVAREKNRLPVKMCFLDEEVLYPETIELAHRHRADPELEFYWVCVPCIYRNACSEVEPDFIPWQPDKRHLWVRQPPPFAIWPAGLDDSGLPKMSQWRVPPSIPKQFIHMLFSEPGKSVITLLGLRTEESFIRNSGLMSSSSFLTLPNKHGICDGRPIYDWTARDVWLAFKTFGWDYNGAYEKLWRLGVSVRNARVAPLFHAEAAMQLGIVRRGWPKFWPLVRRRVRGAQAVANNAGKLHKVERFGGETWEQAAYRYWTQLGSEQDRKDMMAIVQLRLSDHARHSTDPLPDEKDCLNCRLSWKLLARAIARGDRQDRIAKPNQQWGNLTPTIIEEKYGEE